ncbi:MAG: alpha/beta hydrolase [Breznakibacter sp.]
MQKIFFAISVLAASTAAWSQPASIAVKTDIPYYENGTGQHDAYIAERCRLDVYYPTGKKGFATVVWLHGGGLTGGEKHLPQGLTEKGFAVVTANYRLSPKAQCPAYIQDAAAAVAWTFKHIGEFGGNADLIFVSGHSAGGYLAAMVGLDKQWLQAHYVDADRIAGLIPFSGQMITHFTVRAERGIEGTCPVVDQFAPLYHVRPGAPPFLMITGNREMELLGRYEENAYMARMMKLVGHKETNLLELDGYGHDMVYPAIPLLVNEMDRIMGTKKSD